MILINMFQQINIIYLRICIVLLRASKGAKHIYLKNNKSIKIESFQYVEGRLHSDIDHNISDISIIIIIFFYMNSLIILFKYIYITIYSYKIKN